VSARAEHETDCDVAVVGAGPVGSVLAILLGAQGWRVDLLDQRAAPFPGPRAVHLDHEASRILAAAGVMEDLATQVADAYEWRNAAGDTLLRFDTSAPGVSGWPESAMFHQPDLDRLLAARVAALPNIRLRRGCEVTRLTQHPDSVGLATRDGDGNPAAHEARWVVGCWGVRSRVGERYAPHHEDLGYTSAWLVVDVIPKRPQAWHPLNVQVCDPHRPTTMVSGGPGRRRWEFMALPGESLHHLIDRAWELLEPWDVTPDNATIERQAVYTFAARLTESWSSERLILAGDAAHQMPPFAGQGLCSGLRDAANLAWKLDAVLAGLAVPDLIDAYGRERAPQVRTAIDFSIDLGQVICISDPGEAAARDQAMVASAAESGAVLPPTPPPIGPGLTLAGDPQAGQLGRQGVVVHRGRRGRFDDVVGGGWVLLCAEPGALAGMEPALSLWWTEMGGISVQVAPAAAVDDVDGTYAKWFADTGVAVILQRPDFYVFGTAADRSGAHDLLRAARSALGGDT
jgi:2-polyprenyl-6-methoxyphenol hydroxylase-like FAD-dependent oxidoreductase